jgi:nucleotide-binding universal stress UspA family protein
MSLGQILVAVDGTSASAPALDLAVRMARSEDSFLTGLFVLDSGWPDFIGNDWQSSRGARQGFLDHVEREQQAQAEAAREQFERAAAEVPDARFLVLAGDPSQVLLERMNSPDTDLLVFGRRTFQASGRPSLKRAAVTLAKRGTSALLLLP